MNFTKRFTRNAFFARNYLCQFRALCVSLNVKSVSSRARLVGVKLNFRVIESTLRKQRFFYGNFCCRNLLHAVSLSSRTVQRTSSSFGVAASSPLKLINPHNIPSQSILMSANYLMQEFLFEEQLR